MNRKESAFIMTKTPFRISFFGGGTDFEYYFKLINGAVISTAINKFCYISAYKNTLDFDNSISPKEINTILGNKSRIVQEALNMLGLKDVCIKYHTDLPENSGIGSSSSFAVGLLHALYALKGFRPEKKKLADDSIYFERVLCKETGGWQDQIAVTYGGLNYIEFNSKGYSVFPLNISTKRKIQFNNNLMLFNTRIKRISSVIHENNKTLNKDNITIVNEINRITKNAKLILTNESINIDEIGELLDETWKQKQLMNQAVSNDLINMYYQKGKQAGALGGKLIGAGGGGFLLFYVQPQYQLSVRKALCDLAYVPFVFEDSGSQVVD